MEARLRSQNGLSLQWLLLSQESHAWFSFLGTPALPAYNPVWLTSCFISLWVRACYRRYEVYTCLTYTQSKQEAQNSDDINVTFTMFSSLANQHERAALPTVAGRKAESLKPELLNLNPRSCTH